jgi:hypothetical protein
MRSFGFALEDNAADTVSLATATDEERHVLQVRWGYDGMHKRGSSANS